MGAEAGRAVQGQRAGSSSMEADGFPPISRQWHCLALLQQDLGAEDLLKIS